MTKRYTTIKVERERRVLRLMMSRPEIHNAFNEHLIADLSNAFREAAKACCIESSGPMARHADPSAEPGADPIRVVVYTGEGKSFSAGADLNWMKKMVDYSFEENMADSLALAELMYLIYTCPVPTIARVNGAAIGGGVGLLSA
ncbi:MAG: enoyl-CoA hydratase-related protein, partial [bacterium]